MNETQKRIEAYKKALPEIKEKVVAVALLLAMSAAMLTSVSFAWLTLSRAPEVTAVSTTVAANGNLEIALSDTDGGEPDESKVGDSSAAEGQSIVKANTTWGNLVNLGDESYGLDNLVLRPAELNVDDLLGKPLYGAEYFSDGRVEKLNDSFAFTSWNKTEERPNGFFDVNYKYGVRAISSTAMTADATWDRIDVYRSDAVAANAKARSEFIELTQNNKYMESLSYFMGVFMTARYHSEKTNPDIENEHLSNLVGMYTDFEEVFELEAEALAKLLNLQLFIKAESEGMPVGVQYTAESLMKLSEADLTNKGLVITNFGTFKTHYNLIKSDRANLEAIQAAGNVKWKGNKDVAGGRSLESIINSLVNVGDCKINGKYINQLGMMEAYGLMNQTKVPAVITNGLIYEFEQRIGSKMNVGPEMNGGKGLKVEASAKVSGIEKDGVIYVYISTNAKTPSYFAKDISTAIDNAPEFEGEINVQDTYGLSIDFWVRTNMKDSYLTLEGNVISNKTYEQIYINVQGTDYEVYTLTRIEEVEADGETQKMPVSYDLCQYNGGWYSTADGEEFILEEDEEPVLKQKEIITVIGYEGENRVWSDSNKYSQLLSKESTTQGSGSCYVYYADTPEDQARSLELLKSMEVAFVDAEGNLLAEAEMDTENHYAESGRVTVPLVLKSDSNSITGSDGESQPVITKLDQNEPMFISAIVYLDGTRLKNDNVLAAANIQGKLNIQFGNSVALVSADNEELAKKKLSVSASIDNNTFSYEDYIEKGTPMKVNVTLDIDGDQPKKVEAFFIRKINSTQGSRESTMVFSGKDGKWTQSYNFTGPGIYELRSVTLDGQEYVLEECPVVTIEGFQISKVSCDALSGTSRHFDVMTAEASKTVKLSVEFSGNLESELKTVKGRFLRDDGTAVEVDFKYNPTLDLWEGSGTFRASGDYAFQYLILNGDHVELDLNKQITASVKLAMRAAVYTNSPVRFTYDPDEIKEDESKEFLKMQVKITDNSGAEITDYPGELSLTYMLEGSLSTYYTPIEWNADTGYYEGEFTTLSGGPGIWKFSVVKIGSNDINIATSAPVFELIPPEPPSYEGIINEDVDYYFSTDGKQFVAVKLEYTQTANVLATFTDRDGKEYYVEGERISTDDYNISTWNFVIPQKSGTQDGWWTLEKLEVWNFFDENAEWVGADVDDNNKLVEGGDRDVPMTFDIKVEEGEEYEFKVVQTVYVSIPEKLSKKFGRDENGEITDSFMTAHEIENITVKINDFEQKQISGLTTVSMKLIYGGDSYEYGSYTSDAAASAYNQVFALTNANNNEDKTLYVLENPIEIDCAGTYTSAMHFVVNGINYDYGDYNSNGKVESPEQPMPNNAPEFEVWSKKPTVTVTGVTPAPEKTVYFYKLGQGKIEASAVDSQGDNIRGSNSFTENRANIYFYSNSEKSRYVSASKVKLQLTNMKENGFSATLEFGMSCDITVNVPPLGSATGNDPTFTFTGNSQTREMAVGYKIDGFYLSESLSYEPRLYPIGERTLNNISVVYNDITYTVELEYPVTINQQYCPPYIEIAKTASGYELPLDSYSIVSRFVDDKYMVTLPKIDSWTMEMEDYVTEEYSDPETIVETVYYKQGSGCNITYTPYQRTTEISTADSLLTTWTKTFELVNWKIGSKTYNPGDEIEIDHTYSGGTVTNRVNVNATIRITDGEKNENASTTTKTKVTFVPTGGQATEKEPSGSIIVDDVTDSENVETVAKN